MNWFEAIDIYCERLEPSFFAEPFNLWSNLGFIAVAVLGLIYAYKKQVLRYFPAKVLIVLVFSIGIGSFLFHGFANKWSQLADVLPIGIYIFSYLFLVIKSKFQFSKKQTALTLAAFLLLSLLIPLVIPNELVNGSSSYFGVAVVMLWLYWLVLTKKLTGSRDFLLMVVFFCLSLTFRAVDMALCENNSIGTHFLWHIGNSLVIGISLKIILESFAERNRNEV